MDNCIDEDSLIDPPNANSRIDELSTLLSSLQQKVSKLIKGSLRLAKKVTLWYKTSIETLRFSISQSYWASLNPHIFLLVC